MSRPTNLSKKTIRQRSALLVLLLLVAGVISYPGATNVVLSKLSGLLGISNLGSYDKPFVLGLDLQGGTHLEYEADVSRVADTDRKEALNGVRDVIERRVNTLGVSEPLVQTTQAGDSWRVTVELAGIRDVNQAIKLIGETPRLEFKEQNDEKPRDLTADEQKQMNTKNAEARKKAEDALAEALKPGVDFEKLAEEKTENATLKPTKGATGRTLIGQTLELTNGSTMESKAYDPNYADLVDQVRGLQKGTIVSHIVDRTGYYSVVKLENVTSEGKEAQVRHLLVGWQGAERATSTSTKEQALAKIQDLKKQINPQNFEELTKKYSEEPGAAETGGELGFVKKGDLVEAFETPMFAMATGTVSDVIETQFGYHLILKETERDFINPEYRLIDFKKTTSTDIVPPVEPFKSTKLTGSELQSARVDFDQRTGAIQVALQFNDEGTKLFADLTKRNIGKPIAIYLDGNAISVPTVSTEIPNGQAVISGNFNVNDAKLLARRLQAGALPVPIKLIAQQTVGPSLGADSLQKSLHAGLVGFLLVALFMIVLYRLPGLVSIVALLMYAALSAMAFKLIPVTLTLAGIAGFILTLGIALDANVLVFERLKEELKEGKALPLALEDAFRRAWLSIRDGHMTVLISAAVLYWFSSSVIRGFALTLAIGTLLSLFTAIVVTRTFLRLLAGTSLSKFGWLFLKK